jgi:hypothetical protein
METPNNIVSGPNASEQPLPTTEQQLPPPELALKNFLAVVRSEEVKLSYQNHAVLELSAQSIMNLIAASKATKTSPAV